MQKKLNWTAYSNSDRNKIIEDIKNTISKNGGAILNFNMFSDLAMSMCIEIEEGNIQSLHRELSGVVGISELAPHDFNLDSKKEWLVFMNISFGKGKGYLKNEIPEVPG